MSQIQQSGVAPHNSWGIDSWEGFPAKQQPVYSCRMTLEVAVKKIRESPSLVSPGEVNQLKHWFMEAENGQAFLLQGGDCAENFETHTPQYIFGQCKLLTQLAENLSESASQPVVRIGRIAGQYAKPRTKLYEDHPEGGQQWTFRGHNINSEFMGADLRSPDPERLVKGYLASAEAMEWLRQHEKQSNHFLPEILYTSHEGLILKLEAAQTKWVPEYGGYYNLSSHMQWIGERTRGLTGAHIEYFRGIQNPIGIKIGPDTSAQEIIQILTRLNPGKLSGRIMLITRFGQGKVRKTLPVLIQAVKESRFPVVWSCDPMHGNGLVDAYGQKTRFYQDIASELFETIDIHRLHGTALSAVHLELTHENVWECQDDEFHKESKLGYQSLCDPRFNALQARKLVQSLGKHWEENHPQDYRILDGQIPMPKAQNPLNEFL